MTKQKDAPLSNNATVKSGGKSRKKGDRIPGRNGGTLIVGAGRGPKKGAPNAGRPPDQWKAHLRTLVDRAEVLAHIEASLTNGPADEFFVKALEYATDHGYGRATQPVEHEAKGSLADLLTRMAIGPSTP